MVSVLVGNINSMFLGKKIKLDGNMLNYDIGLFFDTRINVERLKVIKSKFNKINKENQFYTCLCREKNPKSGALIYINSKVISKVIETNNQFF